MESHEPLPYWQINCPPQNRTVDCPPFLLGLNDKDKRIVSTPDEDFEIMTWEQVVPIIQDNRLAVFQRIPSQLRRYKAFSYELAKQYGSIASFILRERLQWSEPIVARGTPFECLDDYKILWNDWPYGLDKRIVHLVVWTKFDLQVDGKTGDLTPEARAQIDDFVGKTFRSRVPAENVRWFKNWAALKSIHAVEHFHVMMFDPDPQFVQDITNGDVPQCDRVDV